ncbi:hypothetical protein BZG17_28520, partial [Escherichia coli]|nr:hypothetical protein [Escherichia coli]
MIVLGAPKPQQDSHQWVDSTTVAPRLKWTIEPKAAGLLILECRSEQQSNRQSAMRPSALNQVEVMQAEHVGACIEPSSAGYAGCKCKLNHFFHENLG